MDQLVDAQTELDLEEEKNRRETREKDSKDRSLLAEGAMTVAAAKRVTASIKAAATATWILVKRAHDGKAWKSLGYSTWADYVTKEFDMSASRSYQLINQADVISALESAAPEGTKLMLTEAQTREIKDTLPKITEKVKTATVDDTPTVAADKINKIVDDERSSIHNDTRPDNDDPVQEDAFQDIDPKGSAPKTDRLSVSDSGSTADTVDLDGPISEAPDSDQDPQAMSEDEQTLSYLFSYFDMLSAPSTVAKQFHGDLDKTKDNVDKIVKWFTDFRSQLG
jgi:hypothetical protein